MASCSAGLACAGGCGTDFACLEGCYVMACAAGQEEFQPLLACAMAMCAGDCIGGGLGDPLCTSCAMMLCSAEYAGCGSTCGSGCGNGLCDAGEDCAICPPDCGGCGPVCGNGACEAGEDCAVCPGDCICGGVCGDGVCGPGEDCSTCPGECLCGAGAICCFASCQLDSFPATCGSCTNNCAARGDGNVCCCGGLCCPSGAMGANCG